jgi:hypothetical protein
VMMESGLAIAPPVSVTASTRPADRTERAPA